MSVRHRGHTPFSNRRASVETRHLGVQPGLIPEDQATNVPFFLPCPPRFPCLLHVGPLLLGGVHRFF